MLGELLGFLLVISFIGWGTAFVALRFRRELGRGGGEVDHEVLARLLEDMDALSTRLSRVEEEMDFFKDLRAPETRPGLPPSGPEGHPDGEEAEGTDPDGNGGDGPR
jgi:hypothetical protein